MSFVTVLFPGFGLNALVTLIFTQSLMKTVALVSPFTRKTILEINPDKSKTGEFANISVALISFLGKIGHLISC